MANDRIPTKAYILRVATHPISVEYAKGAAESCSALGIEWEYFDGFHDMMNDELWNYGQNDLGITSYLKETIAPVASSAASHIRIWQKIRDNHETAIVLEHDALMLHKINLAIPDDTIIVLGYNLDDYTKYDHMSAGCPKHIVPITSHFGCYAYVINHITAQSLLEELKIIGVPVGLDNMYFIRDDKKYTSSIPLAIMDPTPAIGWQRASTVWSPEYAIARNTPFIDSFKKNLKGEDKHLSWKEVLEFEEEKMKTHADNKNNKNDAKKLKIAFLDTVGLVYNGSTLEQKGLGGSESAIIFLGRELSKIGFSVTVFNKCDKEGVYDGVQYWDLAKARNEQTNFDIVVVSRTVLPFSPPRLGQEIYDKYHYDIGPFETLVKNAKHKVMWLHDTFILGEDYVEKFLADGFLDEIFTLSDWHTQYIANARHGQEERHFELIKHHNFQTRNGVTSYIEEVDINAKDPNLFVYNASTTKGLVPLLRQIWPRVQREFPDAHLTVIGGYYQISSVPDEIEEMYWKLVKENEGNSRIVFTGIIKQQEIAEILTKASYFIYPCAFPETFGISATEALNYNVPLITTRFGALEEIAPEDTSYLIEFPITMTMNNYARVESVADLSQVERFLVQVRKAYSDSYLRQQKMYSCEKYKPFLGWDVVALQWKHHFYYTLGLFLPVEEMKRVRYLTGRLHALYKRRFVNPEDFVEDYGQYEQHKIEIISPVYNAEKYIENNILSVSSQVYNNYTHFIIDDMSTDNTFAIARKTIDSLPLSIRDKFVLIQNKEKKYALGNQIDQIASCDKDVIIALLDGDDWLTNDPDIFSKLNREYHLGARFTYGSCYSLADKIPLVAQPYPLAVKKNKSYRKHMLAWGIPYTHLRTFQKNLFDEIDIAELKDEDGNYYRAAGDSALFYALIEKCEPSQVCAIQEILVNYNDINPLNDYKVNASEQNKNKFEILNKINPEITEKFEAEELWPQSLTIALREGKASDSDILDFKKRLAQRPTGDDQLDNVAAVMLTSRFQWLKYMLSMKASINSSILDIGAWTGGIGASLYKIGYHDVTCMEISKSIYDIGSQAHPYLKWVNGDIEDGHIYKKYDIIFMGEVLEHLVDPAKTVKKLVKDNLNDGGALLFTVPTEAYVFENQDDNFNFHYEHIRSLDKQMLESWGAHVEILSEPYIAWYTGWIDKIPTSQKIEDANKINILIALPTAKNIETDTFLSIYRLDKPDNVHIHLECFYGYNVDQVRNLISYFGIRNNFDYVFFVDSDIVLPQDALTQLLAHGKDVITGVYIQRKPNQSIPEIYPISGGPNIVDPSFYKQKSIVEIGSCGFGGVLVKTNVLKTVGYPQFYYHDSLDFKYTISEDTDFCRKARDAGFKIYVVPWLRYEHIGTTRFIL